MLTEAQYAKAHALQTEFRSNASFEARDLVHAQLDGLLDPLVHAAETADRSTIEGWCEKLPLGYHRATLRMTVYKRWPPPATVYPKVVPETMPVARVQPKPAAPRHTDPASFSDGLAAAINSFH